MEVSLVLLISSITLFIGYIIGKKEGLSSGYTKGIYEGVEETLKLVEKYSKNGGLKSTLDWETTQRLLKEQMSKN
ncbi:MAG: hypothetical protein CL669_01565 [Balneola sp.]|nr:hypothetical protein [Balneola sp.]